MKREFDLWLETETGEPRDQPANRPTEKFCNAVVTLPDSRRFAINIWTFDFLPLARLPWPFEDRHASPALYVIAPDLFVESLDRLTIEKSIQELLKTGGLPNEWLAPSDE